MKLRLAANSIRFRFQKKEVDALNDGQRLEDTLHLAPGQEFSYAVQPSETAAEVTAVLTGTGLVVAVPRAAVNAWHEGPDLTLAAFVHGVTVSLEKDLQKLNSKPEDLGDSFPNPQYGKVRCDHP